MEKIWNELKYFLKALLCFLAACLLVPLLLIVFVCVHYSNAFVYYILSIKYPELQISKTKKIRSFIDTPRNAGIFNFLLQIKGPCDFEAIRKHYDENLTGAREKTGYLKFPKLRQKLMNCWGHYGWVKDNSSFNLNNHILLNKATYRGSPVHDGNIQDFVSTLVEKYIPSDLPQWQVIVIPIASNKSVLNVDATDEETSNSAQEEQHYYILLKIHHLIIAEEDDLHISEMLMLRDNSEKPIIEIGGYTQNISKTKSLSYFIRKPEHIERLLKYLMRVVVNQWNKFIYEFESLETPDDTSGIQITNISQLLSLLLIVAVNVMINYWKSVVVMKRKSNRYQKHLTPSEGKIKVIRRLLAKEAEQRHLSWPTAKLAIQNSLQPSNLTKTWATLVWKANVNSVLALPYRIFCELMAMRDLIMKGETTLSTTYSGRLSIFLPLLIYAQMEFLRICYEIFKAPVNIFEELVQYPSREINKLNKMSYSGRKIASFSKPIDAQQLRERVAFSDEVRESDYVLSCLSGAIRDYLELYSTEVAIPKMLNTTCRTMAKGYFTDNLDDKSDYIGGVVFLPLPLKVPDREHARQIHSIIEQIRRKQVMIYLASMGQTKYDMLTSIFPRVLTKICINYFSSNFPITITEIYGESSDFETTWGQTVEDVLLFRPPQSKTCLSLNVHHFGDRYRLAVMADTQLGPDHSKIVRAFENYMESVTL
ncbi:uncharacterized protein LOC101894625 [Musca domestica]|uniref:Uncharacterized protein LOC101894625 n=1 Tax=Musca domestica TaxID=7370 RepID=A0A9J7I680_MUSDO|nr:uncharacterized protein LOC101894625 [Musca domestica]